MAMLRSNKRSGGRGICGNLLAFITFCTFAVMTALAAHLYDSYSSGKNGLSFFNSVAGGNALLLALICGSVGLCTTLLGFMHSGFFNESSRFGALAANTVTLGLTLLSLGLNSRSIRSNVQNLASGRWKKEYIAMNAFNIILAGLMLLYVLHLGLLKHDHPARSGVVQNETLPVHNKGLATNNTNNYGPTHTVGHNGVGAGTGAALGAGTGAAVGAHHGHHHNNNGVGTHTGTTGTLGHNNNNGLAAGPYTTPQHHPVV